MKIEQIKKSQMNMLPDAIVQMVNFGDWYLYSLKNKTFNESYILKTPVSMYIMSGVGEITREESYEMIGEKIESIVYFVDSPRPKSLSNT